MPHNMKTYISSSFVLLLFGLFSSCEKVIDIQASDDIDKLVIEGLINTNSTEQSFKLSKNIALSTVNSYPAVSGATVIVHDSDKNEYVFKETTPGTYIAKDFQGLSGKNYSMLVRVDDKQFSATSQLPEAVRLDSIKAEKPALGDKDTRHIKVFYKDPAEQQNFYRFVIYINDQQAKDIYALNDDFNNGNQVSLTLRPADVDIYPGDKIRVEMICIDKAVYNYFYSLMQQSTGAGVTPSNPPSNISPTVLGYFSAQSSSSKTIQVD